MLVVFLLFLALPVGAQIAASGDFGNVSVGAVQFSPQPPPLPESELREIAGLPVDAPLTREQIRYALERLYATGRFLKLEADVQPQNGRATVTFRFEPRWFIGSVHVEGVNPPPSLVQLENITELALGAEFTTAKMTKAFDALEAALAANGYLGSLIRPTTIYDPNSYVVHIRFYVQTGERARYRDPQIIGDVGGSLPGILKATGWRGWLGWKPVTDTRTKEGVERVRRYFARQDRLMAQVRLDDLRYDLARNTIAPVLLVNPGPVVKVETRGARISRGTFRRLVPIFEERSVDRDLLVEGARNLRERLQSEGYFDAETSFRVDNPAPDRQSIEFRVERGEKSKLVAIEIRGNEYFDDATIRERLALAPASFQLRHGRFSRSLLIRDEEAIRDLYAANGFRDVEVRTEIIENYRGRPQQFAVIFHINEGEQWLVDQFELIGVRLVPEAEILRLISSLPDQIYSGLNISIDRNNVLAYYFRLGFFNANLDWSVEPSSKPKHVNVRYIVTENRRQFFRSAVVSGLNNTRRTVVERRTEALSPGSPLNYSQLVEVQRQLYNTGIFSKVDLALQNRDGNEPAKTVIFDFTEARRYSTAVGLGLEFGRFGTARDLGSPAGQVNLAPRLSFDLTRLNMFGRAHTATLRTRVSTLQSRALLSYQAPQIRGWRKFDFTATALFDDSRIISTFNSRRWEGSLQMAHSISRILTAFYRVSYRYVTLPSDVNVDPELLPFVSQPTKTGLLSATLIQDKRDDPVDSTRGYYNTLELGYALRLLGSSTGFNRVQFRNSTYHRLSPKVVFARSTTVGLMGAYSGFAARPEGSLVIPLPERLYAGGASSHRGFPENQAGPRDLKTGYPVGGEAQLLNSLELRFPVVGSNLGAVLFHDAGNTFQDVRKISFRLRQRDLTDFNYMVHAVGLGFRYKTPIGPVRLDLAWSINSPRFTGCEGSRQDLIEGKCVLRDLRINQLQFHFSLGQTF